MNSKLAHYRQAVKWIAHNDEPTDRDPYNVRDTITVALVADVFQVVPLEVAIDVVAIRVDNYDGPSDVERFGAGAR